MWLYLRPGTDPMSKFAAQIYAIVILSIPISCAHIFNQSESLKWFKQIFTDDSFFF